MAGLDNATVMEFAKLINPFDKTSGEATVYGRVAGFNEIGGRPIVQLDGSTQRIPIRTTVKVKGPKGSPGDQNYYAGDRVLVRIKNHEALIISNISTQMTTAEGAEDAAKQYVSDNGFIYAEKISGEQGDFYTLSADKFSATQITGALGHFITVNADRIITDAINAQIANIDTIKASDVVAGEGDFAYLNVDNVLDAKMANLDIANINRAKVNSLFVEGFAIASDATIVNGHITGYLDSVEVNANKITAGTLLVDRLYIKDQSTNNKWKMLTVDDQGQPVYVEAADRINERTITADKLVAHSITTDELNASNITANNSSFMESLTNSLTTNYLFATQAEVQDLVADSVTTELAEMDILNINEELKTQNIHLGEIVFDQPSKPEVMSGNPNYILGIERETQTINAYDETSLYSVGEYVTHYYSKNNIIAFPFNDTAIHYGLTFTNNGDGSITINGTPDAHTIEHHIVDNVRMPKLPNGKYKLTGTPQNNDKIKIYIGFIENNVFHDYKDLGEGVTFECKDDRGYGDLSYISIFVFSEDVAVNNVTIYPKLSKHNGTETPWTPYVKGVYKCITAISTAELWDEKKWFFLRDAINGDQYEFDHVRYKSPLLIDDSSTAADKLWSASKISASMSKYLPISGGIMTGQIQKASTSLSWYQGRDGALVRNTGTAFSANWYNPILSVKSINGTWDIGTYTTSNCMYFSYVTDAHYNAGSNTVSAQVYFNAANNSIYANKLNGVTIGTSPKFTDTNTWPTKLSQLSNDSEYIYGSGTRAGASNFWGVDQMINFKNGNNASGSMIITVKALSGNANKIFGVSDWSDEKIKINIKPSSVVALEIIQRLNPKEFDYIDAKYGGHVDLGFTAQNVESYIPEAVLECPQSANGEGQDITIKALDYQRVVPYLIKAIQEQQEQIDELKQEIKELKEEN